MTEPDDDWTRAMLREQQPAGLVALLRKRFLDPEHTGPLPDERTQEAPEDVLIEYANENDAFRQGLEDALRFYLADEQSTPSAEEEFVLRSVFRLIQAASLGVHSALRYWVNRHVEGLLSNKREDLANEALYGLAATQTGTKAARTLWLGYWRDERFEALSPALFVGLRCADPESAVEEVPELVHRARFGMTVHMYWFDNQKHKLPHLHVRYRGEEGVFALDGSVLEGDLGARAHQLIRDWCDERRPEIQEAWACAVSGKEIPWVLPLR